MGVINLNQSNRKDAIDIPLTVVGGAGLLKDIENLFKRFGLIGACAGSLFVFICGWSKLGQQVKQK